MQVLIVTSIFKMIKVGLILCGVFIVGMFEATSADDIFTAHNLAKRYAARTPSPSDFIGLMGRSEDLAHNLAKRYAARTPSPLEFIGLMGRSEDLARRLIQHPGSMSETNKRAAAKQRKTLNYYY